MKLKMKALRAFKSKLYKPCKKLFQIRKLPKLKLKKPLFIRSLLPPRSRHTTMKSPQRTSRRPALLSGFSPLKKQSRQQMKGLDEELSLRSMSETPGGEQDHQMLFPSPITPTYVKECCRDEDVEDACRSFENYLVEMIVEEGKVGDLTDIEELLYCWKNLKSPVFIDLVCRFYGELCKDLFFDEDDDDDIDNQP